MKSKLLYGLLSLLGFSTMAACDTENAGRCEYGTPHVNFSVSGRVTDGEAPVQGISVDLSYDVEDYIYDYSHEVLTDSEGNYVVSDTPFGRPFDGVVYVRAKDADGEENGSFKTAIESIEIKSSEFTEGDGSWNRGSLSKTLDIVLKPGTDEPEEPQD